MAVNSSYPAESYYVGEVPESYAYDSYGTGSPGAGAASWFEPLVAARIGMADVSILMVMWLLVFGQSIRNCGYAPGILFLFLALILVVRRASNGLLVLLLTIYTPEAALMMPRLFVVSSILASMGFLMHLPARPNPVYLINKLTATATALVVFLGLTILIAPSTNIALSYWIQYVEGLLGLFLVIMLIGSRDDLGRVMKGWAILAALQLIIASVHYVLGKSTFIYYLTLSESFSRHRTGNVGHGLVGVGRHVFNRLTTTGMGPNEGAYMLIFPLGIALAFYTASSIGKKLPWLIICGAILVGVLGTFSRSGFLTVCAFMAMYLLRRNVRAIIPVMAVLLIGALAVYFIPEIAGRMGTIQGDIASRGGTGRFGYWKINILAWLQSPVWGQGLGYSMAKYHHVSHNVFIEALLEGGIIGLGLYLGVICVSLNACRKVVRLYSNRQHSDVVFFQVLIMGVISMCIMLSTISMAEVKAFWMPLGVVYLTYIATACEAGYMRSE